MASIITFKNSLIINRPKEEVFAFLSDFRNMPKWNVHVLTVSKLSGKVGKVGTVYRQVRKTDTQDYEVIEYSPNRAITIETLPPARMLKMRFVLTDADKENTRSTKLTDEWTLGGASLGLFKGFAERKVKGAVAENLVKLKTLLEMGYVRLQDGREVYL